MAIMLSFNKHCSESRKTLIKYMTSKMFYVVQKMNEDGEFNNCISRQLVSFTTF